MAARTISILVDPRLNIDDVRLALRHTSLEIEDTYIPHVFVVKATESSPTDVTATTPVLRQAG